MRVCVTGAAGFIGKHVVSLLRLRGHEVITLDSVGDVEIQADITKPLPTITALDAVIHLAAISHPRLCDEDRSKAFDVNVNGTSNVLLMALKSGAKKVVFSSSAHVYDLPPRYLPTDEVHPLRLGNTYTTTKLLGEQLCQLYFDNHGLSYTTLRLFNAFGPKQGRGFFIPDMVGRAKMGIVELTGANTTKDWVFVSDVADAFAKSLESDFVGPINVGTGIETSLGSILKHIIKATPRGAYFAVNSDYPTRMCADIKRAKRILGWEPFISLEEGLRRTLQVAVGASV